MQTSNAVSSTLASRHPVPEISTIKMFNVRQRFVIAGLVIVLGVPLCYRLVAAQRPNQQLTKTSSTLA
jgi:hypothetical protein